MTIYCVACKKEAIFGDKSRSFHKFPDDNVLKQKWMTSIEISSVTKNTKICSDHFDKSAFVDSDGYTSRRRLLQTAVPCRSVNTDKVQIRSCSNTKDQTQLNLSKKHSSDSVCVTTVNLPPSTNTELPVNIIGAGGKNQQECGRIIDSPVAIDLEPSRNLSKKHRAKDSTNNVSTEALRKQIIQQTPFSSRKSIDNPTNLKRSLPLCVISDVSLNERLRSHNESESTVVKTVREESQSKKIHANAKRTLLDANCSDSSDVSPSSKSCSSNVLESSSPQDVSIELESNKGHTNMKRRTSSIDVSNIPPTKKFRFYDGYQPMYMSRKDFASDEAWTRFLKYTIYKNRQAESCRKRNQRKKIKIGHIKELVSKLREENAITADDRL